MSLQRGPSRARLAAVILVGAAAVYPVAGRSGASSRHARRREVSVVIGTVALGVAAEALPDRVARTVVAAGYALHALFDMTHAESAETRLPAWYPAFCAGYDVAMAATLARGAPSLASLWS